MIRLEVAYTEHAGRFWRGTLIIDGEKAETFNWLHEVNDFIKKDQHLSSHKEQMKLIFMTFKRKFQNK